MTVLELRLIRKIVAYNQADFDERIKATIILDREIKLRTTNWVTGERLPDEPQKDK